MRNVNAADSSPSGTHDGRNPLEFLNQHNVAAAPARGGATSSLDHELQRCLSSILIAPPGEQVQRTQSFKSAITKVREQLSPESLESSRTTLGIPRTLTIVLVASLSLSGCLLLQTTFYTVIIAKKTPF